MARAGFQVEDDDFEFDGEPVVAGLEGVKFVPLPASSTKPKVTVLRKSAKVVPPDVYWLPGLEGQMVQVKNQVYDLTQAYFYAYEPEKIVPAFKDDVTPSVMLCYQVPIPGVKRFFVDPTSLDGALRPLNTEQQLQSMQRLTYQIVWVATFQDELGTALRKLMRDYFKLLSASDDEF